MSTPLLDNKVRITISDLPPRPSQPSTEELSAIFGGYRSPFKVGGYFHTDLFRPKDPISYRWYWLNTPNTLSLM